MSHTKNALYNKLQEEEVVHHITEKMADVMPRITRDITQQAFVAAKSFVIGLNLDDEQTKIVAFQTFLTSCISGVYNSVMDTLEVDITHRKKLMTKSCEAWVGLKNIEAAQAEKAANVSEAKRHGKH